MKYFIPLFRQASRCIGLVSILTLFPVTTFAVADTTYVLRPHCDEGYSNDFTRFGEIPAPGYVVETGETTCRFFDVIDPETLQVGPFLEGDIIDLDIVIHNPEKESITRARAWLDYDPEILEGVDIVISDRFSEVTPGESNFSQKDGQVKIEASEYDDSPDNYWIRVANVQFKVLKDSEATSAISFFNIQPQGNTTIEKGKDNPEDIIGTDPGTLLLTFGKQSAPEDEFELPEDDEDPDEDSESEDDLKEAGESCDDNEECKDNFCYENECRAPGFTLPNGEECKRDNQCQSLNCKDDICTDPAFPNGSVCAADSDCESNFCLDGFCTEELQSDDDGDPEEDEDSDGEVGDSCEKDSECASNLCIDNECKQESGKTAVGEACIVDFQCESFRCAEGICQPAEPASPPLQTTDGENDRTAFGLLQIRGLRVTTENNAVYLGWEALQSSRLEGYNIYYGTTAGEYIQRKSIPGNENTLTVRNLPKDTQYYFAVRGVNTEGEETAFSEEVSITVGSPDSSSAPLVASILTDSPKQQPISADSNVDLPGETGVPSLWILSFIVCAIIGTLFASKRQIVAITPQ